ncbi:MAG: tetratricopeptide repeat protein [Myxococcota bacterium]
MGVLVRGLIGLALLSAGCATASSTAPKKPVGDPLADVGGRALYQRGLALGERGDFVRAEQYLAAAIERGYPEDRALPKLLHVCIGASRLRAALSYAEPYLAAHPNAWSLRYLVASIHLGLGRVDEAQELLEQTVRTVPEQAGPHYLLAVLLRDERDDPEKAAEHFRAYLDRAPDDATHAEEARLWTSLRAPEPLEEETP